MDRLAVSSSSQNRLEDASKSRAAAEIARETFTNLGDVGMRIARQ